MKLFARIAATGGAAVLMAACASTPEADPRYRPAENVLEVVAVLRQHVPDDTYRFEPARDYTGRNVYRSSLLRLESLERVHADALRAGHMAGVMAFSKGRSLERLRAYDLAAEAYDLASERESTLQTEALRSADVNRSIDETLEIGLDLSDLNEQDAEGLEGDPEVVLAEFDDRVARLEKLLDETLGTHHRYIVHEELERTDSARARYFVAMRKAIPDGDVRAVAELQRVVVRHEESKKVNRHLLALADLYADLAVEYADANPPESLRFDPVRFQELVDAGSRIYEVVSNKDGTPEKIEASRRLEAFIAFAITVDNDRFTP